MFWITLLLYRLLQSFSRLTDILTLSWRSFDTCFMADVELRVLFKQCTFKDAGASLVVSCHRQPACLMSGAFKSVAVAQG